MKDKIKIINTYKKELLKEYQKRFEMIKILF